MILLYIIYYILYYIYIIIHTILYYIISYSGRTRGIEQPPAARRRRRLRSGPPPGACYRPLLWLDFMDWRRREAIVRHCWAAAAREGGQELVELSLSISCSGRAEEPITLGKLARTCSELHFICTRRILVQLRSACARQLGRVLADAVLLRLRRAPVISTVAPAPQLVQPSKEQWAIIRLLPEDGASSSDSDL